MKPQRTWVLLILLLPLVVPASTDSAEPNSGQQVSEKALSKVDSRIAKWISQLDSDEFIVRDQATQALIKAGVKSLPAVLKATQSKQPEVRNRAFEVLSALSKSDDQETVNAARTATEEILQSEDRSRVARAKRILERLNIRARESLLEIGARFDNPGSVLLTETRVTDEKMIHLKGLTDLRSLRLDHTKITNAGLEHLKGLIQLEHLYLWDVNVTDAGLKHLRGLTNLDELDLSYTKATDAGLKHLKGMKSLQLLDLSGTKVTDDGVKKLQQELPNCTIWH